MNFPIFPCFSFVFFVFFVFQSFSLSLRRPHGAHE